MKKGGIGGGNTKTGLIFEGKTDLATFLAHQPGYSMPNEEEVYYDGELVARVFKKHKFYNTFCMNSESIGANIYRSSSYRMIAYT